MRARVGISRRQKERHDCRSLHRAAGRWHQPVGPCDGSAALRERAARRSHVRCCRRWQTVSRRRGWLRCGRRDGDIEVRPLRSAVSSVTWSDCECTSERCRDVTYGGTARRAACCVKGDEWWRSAMATARRAKWLSSCLTEDRAQWGYDGLRRRNEGGRSGIG